MRHQLRPMTADEELSSFVKQTEAKSTSNENDALVTWFSYQQLHHSFNDYLLQVSITLLLFRRFWGTTDAHLFKRVYMLGGVQVYVLVGVHVCVLVCLCVYVYLYVCMSVCLYGCIWLRVCVCMRHYAA